MANPVNTLNETTISALKAAGVRYILPQFTDLHGVAKGKLIPIEQWKSILNPGAGFAGPSIWGTGLGRHGDLSEYYGRADAQAPVQQLPWQPSVARVVCDGFAGGRPLDTCSRQTLKRQIERLKALGYGLNIGIEPEFFITNPGDMSLHNAQDTLEKPSYDLNALFKPPMFGLIQALHQSLSALDFDVVQIDHEDAPGQYEINYTYEQALGAADRFMLFKLAAHGAAQDHGQAVSFMPKPFADRPGSGLHFHLSLTDAAGQEIAGKSAANPLLSQPMMHALAGMLKHAPALCALHAPTANSYKRLVIGRSQSGTTWAPAHIAYGYNNRSCVARSLQGRFEWRLPDPSTNVYLAIAGVIAAMVDGLENRIEPPASVDADLYEWTHEAIAAAGIRTLPQSLGEALAAFEHDAPLRAALGHGVSAQFSQLKHAEWIDYARHVSDWELRQYAHAF